jgi:hypothetical protein
MLRVDRRQQRLRVLKVLLLGTEGFSIVGQSEILEGDRMRSKNSTRYIMRTIPIYYKMAPRRNIAPDVLIAQAMVETGYGKYGGDSRPWNMAGIKKGGIVGDEPRDFEKPATARAGVRMHINHMAAYTGKKPIGKPHDRYYDARDAQERRGYWIRRIDQLGGGIWATDTTYDDKIRNVLSGMSRRR